MSRLIQVLSLVISGVLAWERARTEALLQQLCLMSVRKIRMIMVRQLPHTLSVPPEVALGELLQSGVPLSFLPAPLFLSIPQSIHTLAFHGREPFLIDFFVCQLFLCGNIVAVTVTIAGGARQFFRYALQFGQRLLLLD